jgi:hypothetical protein
MFQHFRGTYCLHLQGEWTRLSGCWSNISYKGCFEAVWPITATEQENNNSSGTFWSLIYASLHLLYWTLLQLILCTHVTYQNIKLLITKLYSNERSAISFYLRVTTNVHYASVLLRCGAASLGYWCLDVWRQCSNHIPKYGDFCLLRWDHYTVLKHRAMITKSNATSHPKTTAMLTTRPCKPTNTAGVC